MQKFFFLLLLMSYSACSQTKDRDKHAFQQVGKGIENNTYTIEDLRRSKSDSVPTVIFITNPGKIGLFELDLDDKNTPDNDATVIQTIDGKRYKRTNADNRVNLHFFGAVGNGKADDTKAIQNAVEYSTKFGLTLVVPRGIYRITKSIYKSESFTGLNIEGIEGAVTFNYKDIKDGTACLNIIGGSGVLCRSVVSGITFIGSDNSTGVEISGQCGQKIRNCTFKTNKTGIIFHNRNRGSFTEYSVADDCVFDSECSTAIRYRRTNGNESFNGTGMAVNNLINTKGSVIVVEDGCLPYNSPLNGQIWINGSNSILVENQNTTSNKPTFIGNLTLEKMPNGHLTLSTGNLPTFFCGNISSVGDGVTSGQFVSARNVSYQPNGTVLTQDARYNKQMVLNSSTTHVDVPTKGATYLVTIYLSGANYDYRYSLILQHEGGGNSGFVSILSNPRSLNSTSWGPPSFSCDADGRLVISNPNFKNNKVTVWLTYTQIGDVFFGNTPKNSY
ncbi:glycosyl hydrolase family 28-related protein [Rudanella lutea]|uniref:glycosyl hydrolase family 28-related protein n=1 Tax=Rudanella lutea TaxID=451374 RepID=UPI000380286A|nr:glycosyl hydrolase family 28-related protein [Rudanella lutea]